MEGVDAAVFGMPWDGGASFRSGTRFGPEGIRSPSGMIRTYNAVQRVQVFGAGHPEVGGPTSFQALSYLRALVGLPFVGFDVVEVSPPYDGPGQVTALFAANVIFEMLSLVVLSRTADTRPAPSL